MSPLRDIRRKNGLTLVELARRANTSAAQISKLETGQRQLTESWIRRLAAALECEPEMLLSRDEDRQGRRDGTENWSDEFLSLPVYDLSSRIVSNEKPLPEKILYVQAFREDWLQSISSLSAEQLAIFRIDNDSMEPTLLPGDHVLVELSTDRLGRDGIYLVRIGTSLQVKRVTVNPATALITMTSDNSHYEKFADLDPTQIEAAGKVLWAGRKF